MKHSDEQRIAKIQDTTEKLLTYISQENITPRTNLSRGAHSMGAYHSPVQHRGTCGQPDR